MLNLPACRRGSGVQPTGVREALVHVELVENYVEATVYVHISAHVLVLFLSPDELCLLKLIDFSRHFAPGEGGYLLQTNDSDVFQTFVFALIH